MFPLSMLIVMAFGFQANAPAESYRYDVVGRLIRVAYDDGSSISYTYDNNGNLLLVEKSCCPFVPADEPQPPCGVCGDCTCATCADGRVELCEVIGYACAWKRGCNDNLAPMVRAGFIWKRGECYCWDDIARNWFPTPCPAPASGFCPADASALSFAPVASEPFAAAAIQSSSGMQRGEARRRPGKKTLVMPITVSAPAGASVMALEYSVPGGWEVLTISDAGQWDPIHRKVKWGPFFEDLSRTVTLEVRSLARPAPFEGFWGTVSIDGINQRIGPE